MQHAGIQKVSMDLKVCISMYGFVEYSEIVKSSGDAAYDLQVRAEAADWVFDWYASNGLKPPACSTVTVTSRVPKVRTPDPGSLPTALRATSKAQLAALRADVDMICGAAEATGERWFNDLGPYIAERMKTNLMLDLFAKVVRHDATMDNVLDRVYLAMDKTGVKRCNTIDVMIKAWAESRVR
jgi:hypothetical protein